MNVQLLTILNILLAKTAPSPTLDQLYSKGYSWILSRGPKLLAGFVVFMIGLWAIRIFRTWMRRRMTHKEVHSSLQPFFISLSFTALHIILIVVVMEIVGIELTIFTAVLSAATVAAGLALSGTLQNFAGGVMILLLKPFGIDDNIIAQGQDGVVTEIQIFYTVVITWDKKTVIIPNGKLFNEVIINVTREGKRRLDIELKLSYAWEIKKVKEVMIGSVKKMENILAEPAMYVGVNSLEPDGIKYTVRVWVDPRNFLQTKLTLQEQVISDLQTAGIKLPGM